MQTSRNPGPQSPASYAEQYIIDNIWQDVYPPGAKLPGERDLAQHIGVTRPTLREALQRLARDGWVTIHHGRPTVVNEFWKTGGLNLLLTLSRRQGATTLNLLKQALDVRLVLGPEFIARAIDHDPERVVQQLELLEQLEEGPETYANFDWEYNHCLSVATGNPIFTLIINGLQSLYHLLAIHYFAYPDTRRAAKTHWQKQLAAFRQQDKQAALANNESYTELATQRWLEIAADIPQI